MIKLASEILTGALTKAGVYSVDFLQQNTLINALNDSYRELYTQIAQSDMDYYWKDYTISEEDNELYGSDEVSEWYDLPKDVFMIKSVRRNGYELTRCPVNTTIPGGYTIKNNKIKLYSVDAIGTVISYVPNPQLVTIPAPSQQIYLNPQSIIEYGRMTDTGFYYKTSEGNFFYNFETQTSSAEAFVEINKDYDGYTLEYTEDSIKLVSNDDEIEDIDLTEMFETGNSFVKVVVDDPYMMVSYKDGTIIVCQNMEQTLWNINAKNGHKTLGKIHALRTNDHTLYGCLYEDLDGNLYRASFVPDTMMNYPTNALFKLLEIQLACLLMSMNGVSNDYVSGELRTEALTEFRNELRLNRAMPTRIQNRLNQRIYL